VAYHRVVSEHPAAGGDLIEHITRKATVGRLAEQGGARPHHYDERRVEPQSGALRGDLVPFVPNSVPTIPLSFRRSLCRAQRR
jgi:hypothetical protein